MTTEFVTFDHKSSIIVKFTSLALRGSVLVLLLFIIYIFDIVEVVAHTPVKIRLYAQDYVLYRNVTNIYHQQIVTHLHSDFRKWSDE